MAAEQVRVRELVAWGLDESPFRPQLDALPLKIERAHNQLTQRGAWVSSQPMNRDLQASTSKLLCQHVDRVDLQFEMKGLDWSIGIVDLRLLIAFQRRLIFDDHFSHAESLAGDDWPALVALAFGPPIPITYHKLASNDSELVLQSENPNLQIRASDKHDHEPFRLHGGSPFFEVAEYSGRWFLRDGYHRAFRLMRAGVMHCPAIIVRARTLAELGASQPWFFSEGTLFSSHPPRVTDFLDHELTIEYSRPRLSKTLRITIQESIEPATFAFPSGETK